ncbi:MAG: GDP-mannose 4,6-dehydratase [Bacteroidia bacterium]|nr:GDP-mannose 4,6-dehydratase [Bacteroidia bacterium]MDW8015234.1 GDP-mannose 4,6-dehydratase [Bacteroidia bacterium]
MRILITGGAGFIGSHLTQECLEAGHVVTALDNLSTGSLDNITSFLSNYPDRFRFIRGSVEESELVSELVKQHDVIYHLASVVGVKRVLAEPLATVLEGLRGADAVLSAAAPLHRPVLIASTSEVYGRALDYLDPEGVHKLTEDSPLLLGPPARHRWVYAITKLAMEALAVSYHRQIKAPFVIVRFFNTVGPRQSPAYGMVIPNLVQAALSGRSLPVYGSGQQKRSFLHVKDAVKAIYALLFSPKKPPWGETFNLGNPSEISILSLAQRIRELTGSTSSIEFIPYEVSYGDGFEDMQRRTPDITKIQEWIDWHPQYTLDQILSEVIAHVRSSC